MTSAIARPAHARRRYGREMCIRFSRVVQLLCLLKVRGRGRGALQVAVEIDQTRHVLAGMARQIAGVSLAVLLAAAAMGWLLARRITRRLVRLAGVAEEVSGSRSPYGHHRGIDAQSFPSAGR
jgi:hypothetical protein